MIDFDDVLDEKLKKQEDSSNDNEIIERIEKSTGFPLSDEQVNVVRDFGRPLSVVACAGAGKTSVMVAKMVYMEQVHKVKASSILGISFNKEAVDNLKKRYKEIRKGMGLSTIVMPSFNTFHSLFYSLLRSVNKYRGYTFTSEGEYTYKLLKKVKKSSTDDGNKKVLEDYFNIRGKLINEGYNDVYRSVINGDISRTGISYLKDIDLANFVLVMSTYESIKEERQELDFEDMQLLLYEEVVERENQDIIDRFRLVYQYVFIDEYQDINSVQIDLLDKLMGKELTNNLVTVGDSDQCQPPETNVNTLRGQVKMSDLREDDKVLSWDRVKDSFSPEYKNIEIASRPYKGNMINVSLDGKTTKSTPNHKFLVRWTRNSTSALILLYKEDEGYFLGNGNLFTEKGVNVLSQIFNDFNADKMWLLKTGTQSKIKREETVIKTEYGKYLGDSQGMKILEDYNKEFEYPLIDHTIGDISQGYFECYASNLEESVMKLPVKGTETKWSPIEEITIEEYEGDVYSLDVEDFHSYVSDDIVTLNSIYKFRGSNPDYIVNFILNYENAHRLFLGSNYRSKRNILNQIIPSITKNKVRVDYDMKAFNDGGEVVRVVGDNDKFIRELQSDIEKDGEETIVLVRLNMQQKVLSDVLIENDIDVSIKNERSTVRNDIVYKDIMNVIKAIKYRDAEIMKANSRKLFPSIKRDVWDNVLDYDKDWIDEIVENKEYKINESLRKDVETLYNYTKAKNMIVTAYKMLKPYYNKISQKGYVSLKDVEIIVRHMYATSYDLSLEDFLKRERIKESRLVHNFENGIGLKIQTMHSVKGLEFDNVYLYGLDNTIIPNENRMKNMEGTEKESYVEEERRLFYVAWTRAKNRLVYHYTSESEKSMFITEVE